MFYLVNIDKPCGMIALGTEEFVRAICMYVININELTTSQYQTFIGTLFALDLHKELVPNPFSSYVVRFSPDE